MSNIVVPELGESVVEARIAKWLKKAGDQVEVGEPLVELETEKTNLELSAEKRGVITSIARKEGEDVKIGELLAVVDENAAAVAPAAAGNGDGQSAKPAPTSDSKAAPAPHLRLRSHGATAGQAGATAWRADQRSQDRTAQLPSPSHQ